MTTLEQRKQIFAELALENDIPDEKLAAMEESKFQDGISKAIAPNVDEKPSGLSGGWLAESVGKPEWSATINKLKEDNPGMQIVNIGGRIMSKSPKDSTWRPINPVGADPSDITGNAFDIANATAQTAATVAGIPTGGLGAIGAHMLMGGGSEMLKQFAGSAMGYRDPGYDWLKIGEATGYGAAVPAVGAILGAGIQKVKGGISKGAEVLSGVPKNVYEWMMKRGNSKILPHIQGEYLAQTARTAANPILDAAKESRQRAGKELANISEQTLASVKPFESSAKFVDKGKTIQGPKSIVSDILKKYEPKTTGASPADIENYAALQEAMYRTVPQSSHVDINDIISMKSNLRELAKLGKNPATMSNPGVQDISTASRQAGEKVSTLEKYLFKEAGLANEGEQAIIADQAARHVENKINQSFGPKLSGFPNVDKSIGKLSNIGQDKVLSGYIDELGQNTPTYREALNRIQAQQFISNGSRPASINSNPIISTMRAVFAQPKLVGKGVEMLGRVGSNSPQLASPFKLSDLIKTERGRAALLYGGEQFIPKTWGDE